MKKKLFILLIGLIMIGLTSDENRALTFYELTKMIDSDAWRIDIMNDDLKNTTAE